MFAIFASRFRKWGLLGLLQAILCLPLLANMASPLHPGSLNGLPFSSRWLTVLKEDLLVIPNQDFTACDFEVKYYFRADTTGLQVPMLFIAEDYLGDFELSLDERPLELKLLPEKYQGQAAFHPEMFASGFAEEGVLVSFGDDYERVYRPEELLYFEMDLSKGEHVVEVRYKAKSWDYKSGYVMGRSFRYALAPAKYWKHFGTLNLILDENACKYPMHINFEQSPVASGGGRQIWSFDSLPGEALVITMDPELPQKAVQLMAIGQDGFMWAGMGLAALLHLLWMYLYRRRGNQRKFSWVWLLGSFLAPALALIFYFLSKQWIHASLGDLAAHSSSYDFLIVIFYPIGLILYGLLAFVIDLLMRRRFIRKPEKVKARRRW